MNSNDKTVCGCKINFRRKLASVTYSHYEIIGGSIIFCPLHAAAEEMLQHIILLHENEGHRGMKCTPKICESAKLIAKSQKRGRND